MPTNKVQLNYDELSAIRDRFSRQADAVNQMQQNIRGKMDVLQSGGWIGRGANAFFQEMDNDVLPAVQRLQNAMAQAASEVQRLCDQARAAEESAANLFRRR